MFHLDMAKAEETVGYTAPDLYHLGEFHEGTCRRTTGDSLWDPRACWLFFKGERADKRDKSKGVLPYLGDMFPSLFISLFRTFGNGKRTEGVAAPSWACALRGAAAVVPYPAPWRLGAWVVAG